MRVEVFWGWFQSSPRRTVSPVKTWCWLNPWNEVFAILLIQPVRARKMQWLTYDRPNRRILPCDTTNNCEKVTDFISHNLLGIAHSADAQMHIGNQSSSAAEQENIVSHRDKKKIWWKQCTRQPHIHFDPINLKVIVVTCRAACSYRHELAFRLPESKLRFFSQFLITPRTHTHSHT